MNAKPLKSDEVLELRAGLQAKEKVLREEVADALREIGSAEGMNFAEQVHDLKDAALAEILADERLADARRDVLELQDIEAALARIRTGDYGICIDCGEQIPLPRLRAYPTAKRCRPCQELYERERDTRKLTS